MCTCMYKIGVILHMNFAFFVFYSINYIGDIFLILHSPQICIILLFSPQTKVVLLFLVNVKYQIFENIALASLGKLFLQ